MAIQYIVTKGVDPQDREREVYQGRVKMVDFIETDHLAAYIADQTSTSEADILAVIENLIWLMKVRVMDGEILDLGSFGSFRITIRSKVAPTEEDYKLSEHFKGFSLIFCPGKFLRNSYKGVRLVANGLAAADEDPDSSGEPEGGGESGGAGDL